jgi:hypothetical protein
MRTAWVIVFGIVVGVLSMGNVMAEELLSPSERAARARAGLLAMDRYLETWNTRSAERWATALHFPHVRPGAGNFEVSATREDYVANVDFARTLAGGWRYTRWDRQAVVHVGARKVHVTGTWRRFLEDGGTQAQGQMCYIVTEHEGAFRIQARFAAGPPNVEGDAAEAVRQAARAAIEAYTAAFNGHDAERLADAVHFPHVRHGDDQLEWWPDRAAYLAGPEPGRSRTWAETSIRALEPLQWSNSGANVAVTIARHATDGTILGEYEGVYLVTRRGEDWKVQAISTLGL